MGWGTAQTEAIKKIKSLVSSSPPLQISSARKQILQTDANNSHWSTILLEEVSDSKHVWILNWPIQGKPTTTHLKRYWWYDWYQEI